MIVPVFTKKEFIDFLVKNGFSIVDDNVIENRIILKNNNKILYLQNMEKYFYPIVVKICENFNIVPPKDHKYSYDQHIKNRW